MAGISVRPATPADARVISDLIAELAASMGETSPVTAVYSSDYLGFPGSGALLAEEDGQVIGLLSHSIRPNLFHAGNSATIEELVVSERARGRGVGSALLGSFLARLEAEGCAEVSVSTMPDNIGALRFYKSRGLADEALLLEKHFERNASLPVPGGGGPPTRASGPPYTWFSAEMPVVAPSEFSASLDVQSAVLCFSEPCYRALLEAFGMCEADDAPRLGGACEGKTGAMLGGQVDQRVAVYEAHFGAPAAAMLMECLVASGVSRFFMLGMAGSIFPECRIGGIVIPTWGISEEGVSWHYAPPGGATPGTYRTAPSPSPALVETLRKHLEDGGHPGVREGGVWTLDAIFRETVDKVQRYAERGAVAVEMECTALMSIAAHRKVDFAAILVITDELFSGTWEHDFGGERVQRARLAASRAIAKTLLS
jgi:uridine phosphorylase/GNAT superfamily N-acetyltransferase